jgi:hypothetical protein
VYGVIDADAIADAVRALMASRTVWTGTASDLLGALCEIAGERVANSKTWPDGPQALGGRLRRAATFLRKIGIDIGYERRGRTRTRIIQITMRLSAEPENSGSRPSAPSASSASTPKANSGNGFGAESRRTGAQDADGEGRHKGSTVRSNPLKTNGGTAADNADANPRSESAPEKTASLSWSAWL